jgi:hypothetical protein
MLRFARFLGFEKTKKPAKSQYPLKVNCLAVTPRKKAILATPKSIPFSFSHAGQYMLQT